MFSTYCTGKRESWPRPFSQILSISEVAIVVAKSKSSGSFWMWMVETLELKTTASFIGPVVGRSR